MSSTGCRVRVKLIADWMEVDQWTSFPSIEGFLDQKSEFEDVPLVQFMYLVFTRMPGESCRRRLRPLLLFLCYVFRALIKSLLCWVLIIILWFYLFLFGCSLVCKLPCAECWHTDNPLQCGSKKGLQSSSYMAEKGIEEHHLFLLLGGSVKLVCTSECPL